MVVRNVNQQLTTQRFQKPVKCFSLFAFVWENVILLIINSKNDSKRQQTFTVDYKRLLSALFLTNAFTLQRQTQRKAMETNLPEYIEGIPTEKSESRKRREIIKNEYINLIGNLQKKRGKKQFLMISCKRMFIS